MPSPAQETSCPKVWNLQQSNSGAPSRRVKGGATMRMAGHFFDAVGRGLRGRRASRGRFASLGHTLAPLALDNDTRRRLARAGRSLRRQGDEYLRAASGWDSDDLLRASQ